MEADDPTVIIIATSDVYRCDLLWIEPSLERRRMSDEVDGSVAVDFG